MYYEGRVLKVNDSVPLCCQDSSTGSLNKETESTFRCLRSRNFLIQAGQISEARLPVLDGVNLRETFHPSTVATGRPSFCPCKSNSWRPGRPSASQTQQSLLWTLCNHLNIPGMKWNLLKYGFCLQIPHALGLGFLCLFVSTYSGRKWKHSKTNRHIQILWHPEYFWQPIIQLLRNSFKAISPALRGKAIPLAWTSSRNRSSCTLLWLNTFTMRFTVFSPSPQFGFLLLQYLWSKY